MKAKQRKRNVVVSVLALAGLLAFSLFATGGSLQPSAPPGPTMKTLDEVEPRIPISEVPFTINQSGSYYLTGNLQVSDPNESGITVEVNDVTIDLMGYSLIGPRSGTGCGIYMSQRSNVEIRNGTARDFGNYGILAQGSNSKELRVISVRAVSNVSRGIQLDGKGNLVKDCTAAENDDVGIYVDKGCTVTGNTAYGNSSTGINADNACTVNANTAYDNEGNGISAGGGCTVTGNTAYNNSGTGISGGQGSTISGNTASYNNSAGIYAGNKCTVFGNTACGNNQSNTPGLSGIRVQYDCLARGNTASFNNRNNIYVTGSDNAIEENLVTDCSGGNGINFGSTGNFYANNRASGNGTDYAGDVPTGDGDGGGNVSF
jgi:parallel beta-helix repeat protein